MKGNLSKMLRSGLSLMLALCMLISMAPAAFAAGDYYVALGDGTSVLMNVAILTRTWL